MSKIKRLPDAELEIMNALWDADAPLTAAELETALPGPPRARTTLLTLLARLEEKGCVTREKQGRGYLYTAALTRAAYLPAESRSLWGRLFGGSPRNFVAALAETDTLTDADIDELAEYLEGRILYPPGSLAGCARFAGGHCPPLLAILPRLVV